MKKLLFALVVLLILGSCAQPKTIDGVTYQYYGLANQNVMKNDSILYQISPGSVILGVIFVETIVAPVYIVGWDLYEPVGKLSALKPEDKGVKK